MNTIFKNLLIARVEGAIAEAKAVSGLSHCGLKGLLREVVVRELLQPLLPPCLGIGHGQIISSYNNEMSTEQDIVIFNKDIVPSLLTDGVNGIFPIEAALYAIEVKSKLTYQELKQTHKKSLALESIKHRPGIQSPEHVIPCLFAFDTNLSGRRQSEIERYQKILNSVQLTSSPPIRSICVVGQGYWFFSGNQWNSVSSSDDYAEVIQFLAGILDTSNRVTQSRAHPSLRNYIV